MFLYFGVAMFEMKTTTRQWVMVKDNDGHNVIICVNDIVSVKPSGQDTITILYSCRFDVSYKLTVEQIFEVIGSPVEK